MRWLSDGVAAEIITEKFAPRTVRDLLAQGLAALDLDLLVLPAENRKKRLLIADMDSTLITIECIDELADLVGLKSEVAAITERAMAGSMDFTQALKARVRLLEGVPEEAISELIAERIQLMDGALELVATMRAHTAKTAIVSGGFTLFCDYVAKLLGVDTHQANRLEVKDGKLTGKLEGAIIDPKGQGRNLAPALP